MMHRAHRDAFLSSLRDVEWRGLSHTYAICVPVMGGGGCVCVCVCGGGGLCVVGAEAVVGACMDRAFNQSALVD